MASTTYHGTIMWLLREDKVNSRSCMLCNCMGRPWRIVDVYMSLTQVTLLHAARGLCMDTQSS